MSLARTALRLAVIEALKADPVIAALCDGRIYDSLIGQFDSAQPVPMIVVATEEDGGKAFDPQNGGVPFDEICELLLEIAVRQVVPGDDGEPLQIGVPETDGELDACIDLLEHVALAAITVGDTPQAQLVRKVTRRALKFSSARFASDATGVKLAVREVRLTVDLKGTTDVLFPADTPFGALPDPLRTVCQAMPSGSAGETTCQMIQTAMAGTAPTDAPFKGLLAYLVVKRPGDAGKPPLPVTDSRNPDPIPMPIVTTPEPPHA